MQSNRKRKLVFGINDFLVGGAQMLLIEQLSRIDRDEFEVALVTLKEFPDKGTLYDRLPSGIPVHRLDFRSIRSFASWRAVYRLLRDLRPEVVVSHLFFANTIFRVLSYFLKYKVITVEHNTYIYKSRFEILADRLLATRSARMVAVSDTVASFAAQQAHLSEDRFTVIPNGIDVEAIMGRTETKQECRHELGLPEGRIFVNVARLAYQKNHACLIEGFGKYMKRGGEGILVLVGDGPLRQTLEAKAKDLGDRVRFAGLQKNVMTWYCAADVFVSMSDIEGFSYAHLEAAASGLPLISTATAGADQLIVDGENGKFVPFADASALADVLCSLTDQEIASFGEESRRRVQAFDIRRNVQEYESLIRDVLHGPV